MSPSLITFINILILLSLAIGAPTIAVGTIALFKIKISTNVRTYLYAFTAGLVVILGTVGFIAEAINHSKEYFSGEAHASLNAVQTIQVISVVTGGALLGVAIVMISRYLFTRFTGKNNDFHDQHSEHNHAEFLFNASDIDNKKIKWLPIFLLLAHRLVDGIVLGFMANTTGSVAAIAQFDNWGMIIVFVLHLVPTSIVIYFIQLDISEGNRLKSFLVAFLMTVLMIPFTLIGGFLITNIEAIWWLMPLLYAVSGSLMTLGSILEIIPEFIHFRNASLKQWMYTTAWLSAGIILAILLISVHSH